jgi:hypothetical protein
MIITAILWHVPVTAHYHVDEEREKERREALNAKLKDAGEPPLP